MTKSTDNLTLDKSLQAYRVMNTPTKLSWKQHWAQETFTNNDLLLCSPAERKQFEKRLLECPITLGKIRQTADEVGFVGTLSDIVKTIVDPANKNIPKLDRKVIYSTSNGVRPMGKKAFDIWNGFQVIDMDVKDHDLAQKLKPFIFNGLKKCNWFLGVTLSSSGAGLHVYTKIAIPQSEESDTKKKKMLYLTNFRHKYSFVYLACVKAMGELGFAKDDLMKWMDLAMFKPQQGAFIGYDPHPLINTHFFEDFIYVNFDTTDDICPDTDWVTYPDLKMTFKRWEWFEQEEDERDNINIEIERADEPETDTHNKVHYKHFERWRLANTLVKIYGQDKGYKYLRRICTNDIKDKELQADCITASRHEKPVDEWAVNRLNSQHGFKIKLNIQHDTIVENAVIASMDRISNPNNIQESKYVRSFHLTKDQYLGNIRYDILDACGRLTLIEAGPGLGKTEMVKQLVREGKKILMVMPFQSTIKSKVEQDKDWYYSYGNRKPRLDVSNGLCVTIDKFTRLNLMDVKTYGFDYIFIDESHLMFQSEYRDVMAKAVEMIRNTEVQTIMMSGTPSGELVFFPDIVHIKIDKDDVRRKQFVVKMYERSGDCMFHMCKQMARDIMNGKRILFPTNKGTLYSKQIKAGVTYFLNVDYANFDEVNLVYYKKSNLGDKFMDDVNFEKTIKDVQILLCTTYLSVGVDILDKYDFEIYFADLMLAQEIEQFANRLRRSDLLINMYVAKNDADGNSRSLHQYKEMNFKLNDEEIKNVHSILRICNEMIERNPVEYKYNSLVSSIIRDNKFIEYNAVENRYYLNEISYKLINFERKYREYAEQLPVIMKGMQSYGYEVTSKDLGELEVEGSEVFVDFNSLCKTAYDDEVDVNTKYVEELLNDKISEDRLGFYREVLRGSYEIRKGKEWREDLSNRIITVKSIEVFEKVIPICISLSKVYTVENIRNVFEYCRTNTRYNFAAIRRIQTLVNILFNDKNKRLDLPIKDFMDESYKFSDLGECTVMELKNFIRDFTRKYAMKASTKDIPITLATLTMEDMEEKFEQIFKCLVKCSRPGKNRKITMERIDLLWKWRDDEANPNNKIYIIDDFLNCANEADSEDIEDDSSRDEEEHIENTGN